MKINHRNVYSKTKRIYNGIPQGSSLSVLLWLIFIDDTPLKPKETNIYVDDTLFWASANSKDELLKKLTRKTKKLIHWAEQNKIRFNVDKTKLMLNHYSPEDSLTIGDIIIQTQASIKYLGATFKANPAKSNSTFLIDLTAPAANIRKRTAIVKGLRQYGFTEQQMKIFSKAFIGGKIRYYTPWLAAEIGPAMKDTLHPLEIAYRDALRAECGAIMTTPIPLLHAVTNSPTLRTMIVSDGAKTILNSIAHQSQLGHDYIQWTGIGDGWSPFGPIQTKLHDTFH